MTARERRLPAGSERRLVRATGAASPSLPPPVRQDIKNFRVGTITGIPTRVNVTLLLFLPVLA